MDKFLDDIWGSDRLFLDRGFVFTGDERLLAVVLVCDRRNFERFISLDEFRKILSELGFSVNIYNIQHIQIGIINAIMQSKISSENITLSLKKLNLERIIDDEKFYKISNFLKTLNSHKDQNSQKVDFFHSKKGKLDEIYDKFLLACAKTRFENRLKNAKQKIDQLRFNIVVTGVINAGKSSLLNAILGKNILGSSNIPETTNLSILKFAEKSFARVKFWSLEELKELNLGVLDEVGFELGKEKDIEMFELSSYTSAKSSLSSFVKSVQIFENSQLLKDGICIIDTPGIDDAVFLRERLVRDFMSECDLMVHLMNISQSSTQKDIDFISHSLQNSRISRLVVVLTHIDLLGENELSEVLSYTQKSLKERFGTKVELCFFAVSSKIFFQGGQNSGVSEFKQFLYNTFFGDNNEKSRLAIASFKREIMAVCDEFLDEIGSNLVLLSGSNFDLMQKNQAIKDQEESIKKEQEMIKSKLEVELSKIDLSRLDADFRANLKILAKNLNDRIQNEIRFQKDDKRLRYIVASGLNDGIMHLLRQNRNEILSQLNGVLQGISLQFSGFDGLLDYGVFSIGDYLATQSVKFDFNDICNEICIGKEPLKALDGFLSSECIRQQVFKLVNFEKERFVEKIYEILRRKDENFTQIKAGLKESADLLNSSNLGVLNEIDRLNGLRGLLQNLKMELQNV